MPVVHVKISFRLRRWQSPGQHLVVKVDKYKVFVYPNGVINVTGVRNLNEIEVAIARVAQHFEKSVSEVHEVKVDNVTYTNSFARKIDLDEAHRRSSAWNLRSRYNPTIFPGEFLVLMEKYFTKIK